MKSDRRLGWNAFAGAASLALLLAVGAAARADLENPDKLSLGRGVLNSAAFSHDGTQILTASRYEVAQLWDVETGREIRRFEGHSEKLNGAVFSPCGGQIVTCAGKQSGMGRPSQDNTARLWDVATGKEMRRFEGHAALVRIAMFSPDGKRVLTASKDWTARLWDAHTGTELFRFPVKHFVRPSFSPDGSKILGIYNGNKTKHVLLWDATSGEELCRLEGRTKDIDTAEFSPDGQRVLTASRDGTCRIWDARAGRTLRTWDARSGRSLHPSALNRYHGHKAVFIADGTMILTASADATARFWDAESLKEIRRFIHSWPVQSAVLSSDGKRVLTSWRRVEVRGPRAGVRDYFASLWDAETGTEIKQFAMRPGSDIAVFSPDGKKVLSTSTYTTLWDATTGEMIRRYK